MEKQRPEKMSRGASPRNRRDPLGSWIVCADWARQGMLGVLIAVQVAVCAGEGVALVGAVVG